MLKNLNLKFTIYLILLVIPVTLICVLTVNYFILAWSEPSGPPPNGSVTQDLNLNSHKIINITDPVNNQDAATKAWVLANAAGKPTWAGYTASTYNGNLGGTSGANSKCNSNYSGSHACTWDEIIHLGTSYPWTYDAYVIDGAYISNKVATTKDGYSYSDQSGWYPLCHGYTDLGENSSYVGSIIASTNGYLTIGSCYGAPAYRLPCCK